MVNVKFQKILSLPLPLARGASADEAHELLFDDHAGHELHFGEAAGEGACGLVQRDDLLHGLFRQFLAGRGEKLHSFLLVTRVQIPSERAEQGADPRAAAVKARQDFLENLVVQVGLHPAPHPQFLAAIRDCVHRSFFECSAGGTIKCGENQTASSFAT